jgi:predicted  nucleic acid-binding Zn-ribbon protein
MMQLLQNLLKLQTLEFGPRGKDVEAQRVELRSQIPQQILSHYERLTARGKKGIALVVNNVCTSCHMGVPIGKISVLMRGEDLQLCDSCGRYLCLPDPAAAAAPEPQAAEKPAKPARKAAKRKSLATVA